MLWVGVLGMGLPSAPVGAQPADIVIIGHKDLPESALSKVDLQNIFLGKKATLGSANITFVILKSGAVHEKFLQAYLARTTAQYEQYWKKMVFSGQGRMPKVFETEAALLEYVKTTAGALGYLGTAASQTVESAGFRQFTIQ